MRVELYGSILFLGKIGELDKEGLCELFFEFGREVVIFNSVLLEDLKTLAAARDGKRGKSGASTLEKVNDLKLNYRVTERRAGDVTAVWADTTLANEELGWRAERELEDTLKAAWAWERSVRGL